MTHSFTTRLASDLADVLLMDEAFSALDPLIRYDMQDQLLALQQRLQKTIVFITHDIDEALRLGQNIVILRDGKRSEEHTSELQSLMRISYAVFCLKKKKIQANNYT